MSSSSKVTTASDGRSVHAYEFCVSHRAAVGNGSASAIRDSRAEGAARADRRAAGRDRDDSVPGEEGCERRGDRRRARSRRRSGARARRAVRADGVRIAERRHRGDARRHGRCDFSRRRRSELACSISPRRSWKWRLSLVVPAGSPIQTLADADQPGRRIVVYERSANEETARQTLPKATRRAGAAVRLTKRRSR